MPTTIAVLFALVGMMLVGVTVCVTGMAQVLIAHRREAAVRAPLIASGVGLCVVIAVVLTIGAMGVLHTTYEFRFHAGD